MKLGLGNSTGKGNLPVAGIVTSNLKMLHKYETGPVVPVSDGAAFFDGSDDYVEIGSTTAFNGPELSISAWIKVRNGSSGSLPLIAKGQYNVNGAAFNLKYYPEGASNGRLSFSVERDSDESDGEGGFAYVNALDTEVLGKWAHVAVVYSNTSDLIKIYINGVSKTLSSGSGAWSGSFIDIPSSLSSLRIGRDDNAAINMDGHICNVGMWTRALDQPEVKSIMWKSLDGLVDSEKRLLVSWWNLSADANDSYGSLNGTLT
tara:strand:+ start:566 stop:1345 length:780 start_codon:yes stop_codon:yes gene_type:complete